MDVDEDLPDTQYSYTTQENTNDTHVTYDETTKELAVWSVHVTDDPATEASPRKARNGHQPTRLPLNDTTTNRNAASKMSSESAKSGSTQPFSQGFYLDAIKDNHFNEEEDGAQEHVAVTVSERDRTYATGQVGHVDLQSTKPSATGAYEVVPEEDEENDASDDEFEGLDRLYEVASQFPEERRFQQPKTPATRGKKRTRNGELASGSGIGSTPITTPRPPVNPFAQQGLGRSGVMSLSQVFRATQAPSSPLPNVPTSDGLSERPSPNMWQLDNVARAYGSSPVKTQKRHQGGSRTEPHDVYIPRAESQELREQLATSPSMTDHARNSSSEDTMVDLFTPGSAERKRNAQAERQRRIRESESRMEMIAAKVPDTYRGKRKRGQGQVQADALVSPLLTRNGAQRARKPVEDDKVKLADGEHGKADAAQHLPDHTVHGFDLDGEETQKDFDGRDSSVECDAPVVLDKENAASTPVQVPRTVSKGSRHIFIGAKPPSRAGGLSPYRTESQLIAVANSQPLDGPNLPEHEGEAKSSNVPVASLSRVPDSTEAPREEVNGQTSNNPPVAPGPSQQTVTPPSSSPSPRRRTPTKVRGSYTRRSAVSVPVTGHIDRPSEDELTSPASPKPALTLSRSSHSLPQSSPDGGILDAKETPKQATQHDQGLSGSLLATVPETVSVALSTGTTRDTSSNEQRPRKFSEIITHQMSGSQGIDIDDFTALTNDDYEFRQRMEDPPSSSPVRPARKRIRQTGARRPTPDTGSFDKILAPILSSSDADTTAATKFYTAPAPTTAIAQHEEQFDSSQTSGQAHAQAQLHVANSPESEELRTIRKKRKVAAPGGEAASSVANRSSHSDTSSPPVMQSRRNAASGRQRTQIDRLHLSTAASIVDSNSAVDVSGASIGQALFPNRVWAFFNGVPKGFYPATCLRHSDNNRLRIRFDDGTEDDISSSCVRRLELRVGDVVKTDALRSQVFIVQELQSKKEPGQTSRGKEAITDCQGWSAVRVALRKKDKSLEVWRQPMRVEDLRLTQTIFNGLRGREYEYADSVAEASRAATPSTCFSVPETPASRQRRARAPVKKSGSMRQSFKSSGTQQPLFAEMAFALTSFDRGTRGELEDLIVTHGGKTVSDGLYSHFNVPERQLSQSSDGSSNETFGLKEDVASLGFTALIASKYCRTTNYLHALALNIPCLSPYWIRECVAQKRLVDWRHYLLASGESKIMGDTIISRLMNIPVHFATSQTSTSWPLASMFESRSKLLAGQNVLLVDDGVKSIDAQLFLAYALGADSACVARGEKEARDYLGDKSVRWDWIWRCSAEDSSGDSRSRRARNLASQVFEPADDLSIDRKDEIRIVKWEFVVQSLFIGRLLSE